MEKVKAVVVVVSSFCVVCVLCVARRSAEDKKVCRRCVLLFRPFREGAKVVFPTLYYTPPPDRPHTKLAANCGAVFRKRCKIYGATRSWCGGGGATKNRLPAWSPLLIKPAKLAIKPSSARGREGEGGMAERGGGGNASYRESLVLSKELFRYQQ